MPNVLRVYEGRELLDPQTVRTTTPYGNEAFERLTAQRVGTFRDLIFLALSQHCERLIESSRFLFGKVNVPYEMVEQWEAWVRQAARESDYDQPYVHLAFGQFKSQGVMLEKSAPSFQTVIQVTDPKPLYGDGVHLSSDETTPRPDDEIDTRKIMGLYAKLLSIKNAARARLPHRTPVEALLFPRSAIRHSDPYVAEGGCSNFMAICQDGHLHVPHENIVYFEGLSIRIIIDLFRATNHGLGVCHDLRRSHLRRNGAAVGTATRGLIPVRSVDDADTEIDDRLLALCEEYRKLQYGASRFHELQDKWAPLLAG